MPMIYHYCSPYAFQQIIKSKCLWLSATNNMNDFTEGGWAIHAFNNVLHRVINEKNSDWINDINILYRNNNDMPKYVTCFSKDGDILSQWRAYAQSGEGVSIGFDEDELVIAGRGNNPLDNSGRYPQLMDVEYMDIPQLENEIETIIDIGFRKNELITDQQERITNDMRIIDTLAYLFSKVKNPAFLEEKEKRIVFTTKIFGFNNMNANTLTNMAMGPIKHRISGGFLSSYFDFNFSTKKPIKKIILGPKNIFSDYDVNTFLGFNDCIDVKFERSKATYR
ncbi:DUF2971 domain-containing protein [Yersinia enterocolitica]|nr:DUF2971 domain-containing protein [Yersinia enterocolitica]